MLDGSNRVIIGTARAVGIGGTPTTGQLDVFGSGAQSVRFRSISATRGYGEIYDTTNSASRLLWGYGDVISGGGITDAFVLSQAALKLASNGGTVSLTIDTSQRLQFNANNGTGSGAALLGANSPSAHLSAPYTWVDVVAADGTVCTMPIWQK